MPQRLDGHKFQSMARHPLKHTGINAPGALPWREALALAIERGTARRCEARARSTGQRCKAMAMRGATKCQKHGGRWQQEKAGLLSERARKKLSDNRSTTSAVKVLREVQGDFDLQRTDLFTVVNAQRGPKGKRLQALAQVALAWRALQEGDGRAWRELTNTWLTGTRGPD